MTEKKEHKNIVSALLAIQNEIENPKNIASGFNNKYCPLPDLLNMIKPLLNKNEILMVQDTATDDDGNMQIQTRLIHSSGEQLESGFLTFKGKASDPQKMGSAITYFRRYQITALLGIAGEADDDGESASGNQQTSNQRNNSTSTSTNTRKDRKVRTTSNSSEPSQDEINAAASNSTTQRKSRVTRQKTNDGVSIEERKGSQNKEGTIAQKVEDPKDNNKLLSKLQKEQSKLYMPLKKKFKTIKNRDAIKESHIIQACQELLGEGIYTPDDVGLVKETLDI